MLIGERKSRWIPDVRLHFGIPATINRHFSTCFVVALHRIHLYSANFFSSCTFFFIYFFTIGWNKLKYNMLTLQKKFCIRLFILQRYCYFTESRVYHSTIIKCYIRFLFAYLSLRYIFLLANECYFNKNNGFQWFLYDC